MPNTPRNHEPITFRRQDERPAPVSARPLYPVQVFSGTQVDHIAEVARFGQYLFTKGANGWRVVERLELPGSVWPD
jgi:hypothetical protein